MNWNLVWHSREFVQIHEKSIDSIKRACYNLQTIKNAREGVVSIEYMWQVNILTVTVWLVLNNETHV